MGKILVFIASSSVLIDQGLKQLVFDESVCNQGAAFGIYVPLWIIVLLMCALGGYLWVLYKDNLLVNENKALIYIFFGALSNGLDRYIYGCVIDYIHIVGFFPYFNIADIMISLGGIWYVYRVVIDDKM